MRALCAASAFVVLTALASCSLLVNFDPEGQPCDPSARCLDGYACVDGGCRRSGDGGDPCTGVTCASPPTACHSDAGTCDPATGDCTYAALPLDAPCDDGDPCTAGETCAVDGRCVAGPARTCTRPPNACVTTPGTCTPGVGCTYTAVPNGTTCTDGNSCTTGDACDGGVCVPGPSCPPPTPCQVGSCGAGGCQYAPRADGASCGTSASLRCCGGNCVDISTSALHCGGCYLSCGGQACESVAVTTLCATRPTATSGRCRCNPLGANTCPSSQRCTDGGTASTYPGRCEPLTSSQCALGQSVVTQATCPEYCTY